MIPKSTVAQRLACLKGYSFEQMESGNSSVSKCHGRKQHSCQPSRADAGSWTRQAASTPNVFCRQEHSSRQCCSCIYLCLLTKALEGFLGVTILMICCSFDLKTLKCLVHGIIVVYLMPTRFQRGFYSFTPNFPYPILPEIMSLTSGKFLNVCLPNVDMVGSQSS